MTNDGSLGRHLPVLLRAAGVDAVELNVLARQESFRGAEVSEKAQAITGPAREEHLARGFGFFEFVLSSAVNADSETRSGLLRGALRHNSAAAIRMSRTLDELAADFADGFYDAMRPRTLINLMSTVEVGGQDLHLPMLDLGVACSDEGRAAALDALDALGIPGLVFDSGRSYHFYGTTPMTWPEVVSFLARAQLLSPIVDARWISHQFIDGRCGLRISTDPERSVQPIRLVASVG